MINKLSKVLIIIGMLIVLLSIFINLQILGQLLAQDGSIDILFITNYFWFFKIFLLFVGIILIINTLYITRILKFWRELILLFFIIVFCLLIIELFSFFIAKHNFTHWAFADNAFDYKNAEYNNAAKFNSWGFRDDEFNVSKNYRIAIVGDSFVFGVGVEENQTFTYLIKKQFAEENQNIGVYNKFSLPVIAR